MSGENRAGDVGSAFRICSCNSNGLFKSLLAKRDKNNSGDASKKQSATAAGYECHCGCLCTVDERYCI